MRPARITFFIFLILSVFGCGFRSKSPPEPASIDQAATEKTPKLARKSDRKVSLQMVEEYARIYQISDLETAQFYLTHPDYAREHPYIPTPEDIAFYERKFQEKVSYGSRAYGEQDGLVRARGRYNAAETAWESKYKEESVFKKSATIQDELSKAETLYKQDRFDEAINHMEMAVNADPESPTLLYDLGVMHMRKRNHYEAIEYFQSSIESIKATAYTNANLMMHPEVYLGAYVNLGLVYNRIGMYNEAIEALREAIRFKQDDLDANWNLATVYWYMGDVEKSAAQMRKYINMDPDNAEAHNIIGLNYYVKRLYNAALDEFRIAVRLNPDEKQYSYNEALALARLDRYDEAEEAFDKAAGLEEAEYMRKVFADRIKANKARKLHNEGCSAMESLNLTRAIEHFKAALELKPDMVETHINLGSCYAKQGDKKSQIKHFEEAVRLRPDLLSVRYSLGLAYYDARMYGRAIIELKRAIELNSSNRDTYFKLGMALCKVGNYADATPEFEKCVELSPNWFEARLNLGTCYLKTNNADGAMKQFEKAVQLRPRSAEAQYNLGAAYVRAERMDEASEFFRKALKINPGHSQARITLEGIEAHKP